MINKTIDLNLKVDAWPVERLVPSARNARTHSSMQVAQIAASISEFGFNNPVLIGPSGDIIAGHGRVLAARKLRMTELPVIVLGHLTPNQKRAFMLADNQLALNAGWDLEMLQLELEALAEQNFDLRLTGFDEKQLAELLGAKEAGGHTDPDAIPEVREGAVSRPGDLWRLGPHRLLCGDGTRISVLKDLLEGGSCDLIFTDPPYNVDYTGKGREKLKLTNDNLGDGFSGFLRSACEAMLAVSKGAIYVCMSSGELHRLHEAFSTGGGHWSTYIIWAKNAFTLGRSDYHRQYESILYGWPERSKHHWCGDRNQSDLWEIARPVQNDVHPTMKPVELIERAIRNSSRLNDIVLDPFAGSGSTLIACENEGRLARLVEIDPAYVDVIIRRWQQYSGIEAVIESDGRSFEYVSRERSQAPVSEVSRG